MKRAFLIFGAGILLGGAGMYWLISHRVVITHAAPVERPPAPQSVAAPTPSEASGVLAPPMSDEQRLIRRRLILPIPNYSRSRISDTFSETRGGRHPHEALDLMATRGTPVVAVDGGKIAKLFTSQYGGLTLYQFDGEELYCYYYAHLDRYAGAVREGMAVKRGDLLAYVGSSGNAKPNNPHLHFAIFKLGPEKNWWQGTAINPYPILLDAADR